MLKPKGPYCQSCGMPLSKDQEGGGTNADGSKSLEFCSHCFREGKFTEPSLTLEDMKTKVKGRLSSMHIPGFLQTLFTKDIPNLKRWKKL